MPLHQRDVEKLLKVDFTIIRADYERLVIAYKIKGVEHWKILESGFPSKAALERRMIELSTIINNY